MNFITLIGFTSRGFLLGFLWQRRNESEIIRKNIATLPEDFDFGTALHLVKAGQKIARKGWNGKVCG